MDEFKEIPVEVMMPENAEEGLSKLVMLTDIAKIVIEREYGTEVLGVKPFRFFQSEHGALFEYLVKVKNGQLSAKLIAGTNPKEVLAEYYRWERGDEK